MSWKWVTGGVIATTVAGLAASGRAPAAPIVAGRGLGAELALGTELAPLEARVARVPGDERALTALVEAYLERAAPGLAQAALERAPQAVREHPEVADARVRTLIALGSARAALGVQEALLAGCQSQPCPIELEARGTLRARWLRALNDLGVDDASAEPERALLAYRQSMVEVRLELD